MHYRTHSEDTRLSTQKLIGEQDPRKRACRFCANHSDVKKFSKNAHAISKALGNEKLFLCDECDECNEFFGTTIEKDIANYLQVFRTHYNVKGYKENIQTNGTDFTFKFENGKRYLDGPSIIKHISYTSFLSNITLQNVYKSLCKFTISSLPKDHPSIFSLTIDWIRNRYFSHHLPKLLLIKHKNTRVLNPVIHTYLPLPQNVGNIAMPVLSSFHFQNLIFLYIVPFTNGYEHFPEEITSYLLNTMSEKAGFKDKFKTSVFSILDFSSNSQSPIYFNFRID